MTKKTKRVVSTLGILALLGGSYFAGDVMDVIPGPLTVREPVAPPNPFPTLTQAVAVDPDLHLPLSKLDTAAPQPSGESIESLINEFIEHHWAGPASSVVIMDSISGDVLGQSAAGVGRTPASTAKLLVAVSALKVMSPDTTFTTKVVQGSTLSEVVIVGGGDMMLNPLSSDPDLINGRAGLEDLAIQVANELKLVGVDEVKVRVDDSLFSGATLLDTWENSYYNQGYVAPVQALGTLLGLRDLDGATQYRSSDPALRTGHLFAERLREQGLSVSDSVTRVVASDGARELAAVESATLGEWIDYFLTTSDNTLTEVVARLVAVSSGQPASFAGGSVAVLAALRALGIDTSAVTLDDGSGLSQHSRVPAQVLADVLFTARHDPTLRMAIKGLPIAGMTGTLSGRMWYSDALGTVRAKTGSLPGVTTLAGLIYTADGRELIFAVMQNGTTDGQLGPRKVENLFLETLAGCGC